MATFKIVLNGQETEIEATRQGDSFRVRIDGITRELNLLHRNGCSFVIERESSEGMCHRIRAAGHLDGDGRQIWVNGRAFTYERLRPEGGTASLDHSNALSSTIPAVVSQVLVDVGDRVSDGDKLILLESMKMIIPIQAPCDGTVVQIHCNTGDAIQPGVQLVEIEEMEM